MEDYEEAASAQLGRPPSSRRRGHRWLLMGGLAFAFMLVLGVGAILGSLTSTTQAASAIKIGTRINVMGTHNSDGSITAPSIDIG